MMAGDEKWAPQFLFPFVDFLFLFLVPSVAAISWRYVKLPINPVHSSPLCLWSSTWTQVLEAEHEYLNLIGPRVGGLYGKRRSWYCLELVHATPGGGKFDSARVLSLPPNFLRSLEGRDFQNAVLHTQDFWWVQILQYKLLAYLCIPIVLIRLVSQNERSGSLR